jgi:hypothetical protein
MATSKPGAKQEGASVRTISIVSYEAWFWESNEKFCRRCTWGQIRFGDRSDWDWAKCGNKLSTEGSLDISSCCFFI